MRLFLYVLICLLYISCSQKITTRRIKNYTSLDSNSHVDIMGVYDTIPSNAEIIGTTSVGDKGLTINCDLKTMLEIAKSEARKIGGNCIKLTRLKAPNSYSSLCFRISAQILKINKVEKVKKTISNDYALIHVFRFNDIKTEFELHLGDSLLGLVKDNWRKTFRIYKEGANFFWIKGIKKTLPIEIKKGVEYYIFCQNLYTSYSDMLSISYVGEEYGKVLLNSIQLDQYKFVDILVKKDGNDFYCFIEYEDNEKVYYSIYRKKKILKYEILKSELREIIRNK